MVAPSVVGPRHRVCYICSEVVKPREQIYTLILDGSPYTFHRRCLEEAKENKEA